MYTEKEKEIIDLVKVNCRYSKDDNRKHIDFYLNADEWEIAFEILILDLAEQNIKPEGFDAKKMAPATS